VQSAHACIARILARLILGGNGAVVVAGSAARDVNLRQRVVDVEVFLVVGDQVLGDLQLGNRLVALIALRETHAKGHVQPTPAVIRLAAGLQCRAQVVDAPACVAAARRGCSGTPEFIWILRQCGAGGSKGHHQGGDRKYANKGASHDA